MEIEVSDGILIVRLREELRKVPDEAIFDQLAGKLGIGPPRVAVCLNAVEYVSSSGIGALVRLYKDIRDRGGALCIAAASRRVQDLLHLAGVDLLFDFADDESAALQHSAAMVEELVAVMAQVAG